MKCPSFLHFAPISASLAEADQRIVGGRRKVLNSQIELNFKLRGDRPLTPSRDRTARRQWSLAAVQQAPSCLSSDRPQCSGARLYTLEIAPAAYPVLTRTGTLVGSLR